MPITVGLTKKAQTKRQIKVQNLKSTTICQIKLVNNHCAKNVLADVLSRIISTKLNFKTMLRTEGKFTIYKIEHQSNNKGSWCSSIENEHFFRASGDCWQKTGVYGTFHLEEAKKVFSEAVSKLDKNRKFRLVCVTIEQSKKVLS